MNDNDLIENAILAFLHHYPDHHWKDQYDELLNRVRALQNEQPNNTQTRKRGRPAKRQRKKATTSNTTSTKESKEVDKETQ